MISCGNCSYLEDCDENYDCPFWEDDDYDEYDEQLTIQKMQQEVFIISYYKYYTYILIINYMGVWL